MNFVVLLPWWLVLVLLPLVVICRLAMSAVRLTISATIFSAQLLRRGYRCLR